MSEFDGASACGKTARERVARRAQRRQLATSAWV